MTTKHQQFDRLIAGNTSGTNVLGRFFLVLLILTGTSIFAAAQQRYTVARPITTSAVPFQGEEAEKEGEKEEVKTPRFVPQNTAPIRWETDYQYAMKTAERSTLYLLIYLYADDKSELPEVLADVPVVSGCREFSTVVLDDDFVRAGLAKYVALKLPMDAKVIGEEGVAVPIYSLPGFEHMLELPGLVVIDFAHRDTPHYGEVVGILPFLRGESPTPEQTETFLNLPPGTLTQRTLTYAVRIHPDRPLSGDGVALPIVMKAATDHATYQAERGILGHFNFGTRSNRVREALGGGSPSEICAQTRNDESLFEAALSCMRLWRHSSGHWSIAKKSQRYFGYDMVRSKNGSWYGVGFFIN